ncbi:competence protein ComEA [Pedobacter sp. CG_S7]|uniref:ComEA family DNA-binding protein n=1 Tax=Pedobacter sp. CG_S7 TaxID=3143930 RepID=UPI003398B14C
MRKWLTGYFDITKGEFNGLLVLVTLIIGITLAPVIYGWVWPIEPDHLAEDEVIIALQQVIKEKEAAAFKAASFKNKNVESSFKTNDKEKITVGKIVVLKNFDPNTLDKQGWQMLGFSEKQAQAILNYVQKGGVFRKVEDLEKLYVVSPETYKMLKPYVRIKVALQQKENLIFKKQPASNKGPVTVVMVEINSADTLVLDKIRGIGPAFARRIVKYRERIGGFHKKEQLMEVFGLDSVKFKEIKDQVYLDVSGLKKLNINTAKLEDFKNNPYLRYKQVNAILQYRAQHGNYGNFADLKKVAILTPEILEQLAPYISFTP